MENFLKPIELNDDEILAVSGAISISNSTVNNNTNSLNENSNLVVNSLNNSFNRRRRYSW